MWTINLDTMIHTSMIVHVTRTIDPAALDALTGPSPSDAVTDDIIADFRATIGAMKCAMSERLVRLGISMAQLNIMYTLRRDGEMTMSRLADVLGVSLSNATGLVDRMEERGFVERTRVPEDRRVVRVRITTAGSRVIEENDTLTDDVMRDVLHQLDPDQRTAIALAVGRFRSVFEATTDVAPERHPASMFSPRSR